MFSANSSQVSEDRLYVEDVFSVYVYAGNNTSQTITNGIDLSGKGGMVWTKDRTSAYNNVIVDSTRSLSQGLITNNTNPNTGITGDVTSFNSNGYSLGNVTGWFNNSGDNYVSWTFRKAPKFFDVVTYTGNGVNGRQISHSLGTTPGCIIYKCTSTAAQWLVLHRSLPNGFSDYLTLETTDAASSLGASFAPTSTTFTMSNGVTWNQSGQTYVAYLFAHDTTSDGIIQCGSYTGTGATQEINLGWEAQWILVKRANNNSNWLLYDTMRGMSETNAARLAPNVTDTEGNQTQNYFAPTSRGFKVIGNGTWENASGETYIYIAIRRGPMRTPTSGTSVYGTVLSSGTNTTGVNLQPGILSDLMISRSVDLGNAGAYDRLRGVAELITRAASGEGARGPTWAAMNGVITGSDGNQTYNNPAVAGTNFARWFFRRAPSFFDEVCYTGTGVARTVNHNLGVVPELMIVKRRDAARSWIVYSAPTGATKFMELNASNQASTFNYWNDTDPTTTVFSVSGSSDTNASGGTYVSYLFASCPGVSKCGSYTGNGSSQTINCGFAAGARFILIKRTDSTGNWVVFDSARGIVSGNDPSLLLNSTDAETNYDDIDPDSSGFIVNQSTNNLNVSSGQYIYLAIS